MDGLKKYAGGVIEKLTNFIHLISVLQGTKKKTLHTVSSFSRLIHTGLMLILIYHTHCLFKKRF